MRAIKQIILSLSVVAYCGVVAGSAKADSPKLIRAAVAVDTQTKPATKFSPDVPKLYAFYIGEGLTPGAKLRGVWIAEDVGEAAPKNTKIDEATTTAETPTDHGAFSISKPTAGWPIGSYRVEFYVGENLVETTKFTIAKGDDAADASDEEEGDDAKEQ